LRRPVFVIIADQIASRETPDIVADAVLVLNERYASTVALPVDRTAGDEIQVMTTQAVTALGLILDLTRSNLWSVGCAVGAVRAPLPSATREASGPGFVAARNAVNRAKKRPLRFALEIEKEAAPSAVTQCTDAEALMNLLLELRSRRSREGWEVFDALKAGLRQNETARKLGITPPSVNARVRRAGVATERAATEALARLFTDLAQRIDEKESSA
jgi:hypothetical protein